MKLRKKEVTDSIINEAEVTESNIAVTKEKKGLKIAKTILNVFINVLIVVVLIVSILIATMALTSKKNGVSVLFGRTVQTIQSDSMMGNSPDGYEGGDFKNGDLVLGWPTDGDPNVEHQVGDIITFWSRDTDGSKMLIAHRIVDKIQEENGLFRYQTWGDNREVSHAPDQDSEDNYLTEFDIASVIHDKEHKTTVWQGVGGFLDFIRTSQGFFFIVLIPMIIFFLYAILRVVINSMNYSKAKAAESAENSERDKQAEIDAAVKAALAAAGVKNDADNASDSPEK